MQIQFLGTGAGQPSKARNVSSLALKLLDEINQIWLFDCGEGTQMQLSRYKIRRGKLNHIFISHLHGDHFYGLIGLISTFMLLNRENDLHVYGPKGIKEIILLQLRASGSFTGYNLYFHELESTASEVIFEDETVIVKTIPLNHRVYTNGFLFQEKVGKRHLNIEAVAKYKIEKCYFDKIKSGGSVTLDSGEVIDNELLSFSHFKNYPNYLPYIGKDYSNSKKKILIIAESHFYPDEDFYKNIFYIHKNNMPNQFNSIRHTDDPTNI